MEKVDRPTIADHVRAYRRRLAANGKQEVMLQLPRETVALLDELKERQGLRNRSQALLAIDRTREGNRPAVIDPETRKPALPGGLSKLVTGLEATVGEHRRPQPSR